MYRYKLAQLIFRKGPIKLSVKSLRYFSLRFPVLEVGSGTTVVRSRISDITGHFWCVCIFACLVSNSRES